MSIIRTLSRFAQAPEDAFSSPLPTTDAPPKEEMPTTGDPVSSVAPETATETAPEVRDSSDIVLPSIELPEVPVVTPPPIDNTAPATSTVAEVSPAPQSEVGAVATTTTAVAPEVMGASPFLIQTLRDRALEARRKKRAKKVQRLFEYIQKHPGANKQDLMLHILVTGKTLTDYLDELIAHGKIEKIGTGRRTVYRSR
jgi:hypothetical protein